MAKVDSQFERNIQSAIDAFESGEFPSIRATSKAYNVSEPTLRRRIHARQSRQISHEKHQRLSKVQEDELAQWITERDRRHQAPSFTRCRGMAECILRASGDNKPLGKA